MPERSETCRHYYCKFTSLRLRSIVPLPTYLLIQGVISNPHSTTTLGFDAQEAQCIDFATAAAVISIIQRPIILLTRVREREYEHCTLHIEDERYLNCEPQALKPRRCARELQQALRSMLSAIPSI